MHSDLRESSLSIRQLHIVFTSSSRTSSSTPTVSCGRYRARVQPLQGPDEFRGPALLEYFRLDFFDERQELGCRTACCCAKAAIAQPARLAQLFDESVRTVEREYRKLSAVPPAKGHVFGAWADTKIPHGAELRGTVDVAARLSERATWKVEGDTRLDFRYLDREVPLARAKPKPKQDPGRCSKSTCF